MSRLISEILDTDRLQFKHLIDGWESRSGRHGHDLRLYSDMRSRAVAAVKILGLDPTDTVSSELYFALQERARADNDWLQNFLKILPSDKPDEVLNKITKWVEKNARPKEVWVCKPSSLKNILKKQPPKILMKTLGLRSIDSILKRNSVTQIITLAFELESGDWIDKFKQNYKKFKVSDFDVKKITFEVVDAERIPKLEKAGFNSTKIILPNYETGNLTLIPPKSRFPLDVLAITATVLESTADLRRHSAYFRALSVRKDFGLQFLEVASKGIIKASSAISEIGWNSIHRHLVGNEDFMTRIEQPYITYEEFSVRPALHVLSDHDPRFEFWRNLEYAFYHHGVQPAISMNLIDVVANASNKTPFVRSNKTFGKSRLWEELWARYLTQDHVAEEIIDKFLEN